MDVVAAANKLLNKPDNDISVSSVWIYMIIVPDGVKRVYIPGSNLVSISPYFSFKSNPTFLKELFSIEMKHEPVEVLIFINRLLNTGLLNAIKILFKRLYCFFNCFCSLRFSYCY